MYKQGYQGHLMEANTRMLWIGSVSLVSIQVSMCLMCWGPDWTCKAAETSKNWRWLQYGPGRPSPNAGHAYAQTCKGIHIFPTWELIGWYVPPAAFLRLAWSQMTAHCPATSTSSLFCTKNHIVQYFSSFHFREEYQSSEVLTWGKYYRCLWSVK